MLLQEQRKAANMSASFERQKLMQSFEKLQVRMCMHRVYMLDCAHDPIKSINAAPARFHHNRDHNGHCELQLKCSFDHQPLIYAQHVLGRLSKRLSVQTTKKISNTVASTGNVDVGALLRSMH